MKTESPTFGQAFSMLKTAVEQEASFDQVEAMLTGGWYTDLLKANFAEMNRGEFRKACCLKSLTLTIEVHTRTFPIRRDSRSLEEKTKLGFYYVNSNLTSVNFKRTVEGSLPGEAVLINFGEFVESDDAVSRLDKMGLRPGLSTELVDLSTSNPDSTEFAECLPVNALGDCWQDASRLRVVACLSGHASRRKLGLSFWQGGWIGHWWFLAFRK